MELPPPLPSPTGLPRGLRFALVAMALVVATAAVLYAVNPLGTVSADPRMRLLGHARFKVASDSMLPTLARGDYALASALSLVRTPLATGDIVVFRPPHREGSDYIARVVGLPGDRVRIEAGRTWINGVVLDEPFLAGQALQRDESRTMAEVTVPAGGLWLLGDNRDHAEDSRYWGAARLDRVVGRVVLTY